MKRFLWSITVLMVLGSCSVFESRKDCLGTVEFDFSKVALEDDDSLRFVLTDACGGVHSAVYGYDEIPTRVSYALPQGAFRLRSYYGDYGAFGHKEGKGTVEPMPGKTDGAFVVPTGQEFPPLYAYSLDGVVSDTPLRDTLSYTKRFCNIKLIMTYDDVSQPYTVIIHGNIVGYNEDFVPIKGVFRYNAHSRDCNIPAQLDGSLALELRDDNNLSRKFAIGQMILSSGYDWKAQNLEDIVITLEYSTLQIKIGVDDWSETYEFVIEL